MDPNTLDEDAMVSHLVAALNDGPITTDDDGDVFSYHLIAGPGQHTVHGQAEVKHNT